MVMRTLKMRSSGVFLLTLRTRWTWWR